MSIFKGKEYRICRSEDDDDLITYITDNDPNGHVLYSDERFFSDCGMAYRIEDGKWTQIDLLGSCGITEINNIEILSEIQKAYDKCNTDCDKIKVLIYAVSDFIINEYSKSDNEIKGIQIFSYDDINIQYNADKHDPEYCYISIQQIQKPVKVITLHCFKYLENDNIYDLELLLVMLLSSI